MTGDVVATVIQDTNNNGVANAGEPGLAGWTVYVDIDRNGALTEGEPSAVTDAAGRARITGVPDDTWDVREVLPAGYTPARGFDVVERTRVRDGQTVNVSFLNAAVTAGTGTIRGTVWNDVNRDGVRDADDAGVAGWTVFLDLNTDRFLSPGEPAATTDAAGAYSFTGLAPGRYRVREVTPSGWDPTLGFDGQSTVDVAAGATRVADFGNFNVNSIGSIRGTLE